MSASFDALKLHTPMCTAPRVRAWVLSLFLLLVGCHSENANVALSEHGSRAFATSALPNHEAHRLLDGNMLSGWAFQGDLEAASVIIVFRQMMAANSIRLFTGVGGGQMASRFRLFYTTSLPENVSDPEFFDSPKWREMGGLAADAEGVDIMDSTVFALRQDVVLTMPLMLLRGLKVAFL